MKTERASKVTSQPHPKRVRHVACKELFLHYNKNNVNYRVEMCRKKERYNISVGTSDEMTEIDALARALILVSEIKRGTYRRLEHTALSQFCREVFLPTKRQMKDFRSIERRVSMLTDKLGGRLFSSLVESDVVRYVSGLDLGYSASTYNHHVTNVAGVFKLAYEHGYTDRNLAGRLKRKRVNNFQDRVFDIAEFESFIYFADKDLNPLSANSLKLAGFTGLRISNVISLTKDMVDDKFEFLDVPHTKNGKSQRVFLNSYAADLVKTLCSAPNDSKWLFPSDKSAKGHITYPRECFERILQAMENAGVLKGPATIHVLRRSFATILMEATSDLSAVSKALGHSNTLITQERYVRLQDNYLRNSAVRFSEVLNLITN